MEGAMMTIVTHVTLKEGSEPEWDRAMRARLGSVRGQVGWICTQLLIPNDGMNKRVIIGTWQTRADWEAWHRDPAFAETRARLDGLEAAPRQEWWHEVMLDARASELDGLHGAVGMARDKLASVLTATADWLRTTNRGGP
jgi:heme-degrading monooxygenase HmoA